jgi:hypothetical protein
VTTPLSSSYSPSFAEMVSVYGLGKDVGKTFFVPNINPMTFAGYMLRFVAALRVESYEGLMADILARVQASEAPIDTIMHVLQGCDPLAIHALLKDLVAHVTVNPDPKYPTALRPVNDTDISELKTLGAILAAIASTHLSVSS